MDMKGLHSLTGFISSLWSFEGVNSPVRSNLTDFLMNVIIAFLALLKQQRERPEKFKPERGFQPWPRRCQCGAPPVELSGQLGAGRYVGRL